TPHTESVEHPLPTVLPSTAEPVPPCRRTTRHISMLVAVIRCASVRVTLVGVERVRPCVTHTLLSSNATTGREASRVHARHGVTPVATATATTAMASRPTDPTSTG